MKDKSVASGALHARVQRVGPSGGAAGTEGDGALIKIDKVWTRAGPGCYPIVLSFAPKQHNFSEKALIF